MSATGNYVISGAGNVGLSSGDSSGITSSIPAVGTEFVLPLGCTPAQFQDAHVRIVTGKQIGRAHV